GQVLKEVVLLRPDWDLAEVLVSDPERSTAEIEPDRGSAIQKRGHNDRQRPSQAEDREQGDGRVDSGVGFGRPGQPVKQERIAVGRYPRPSRVGEQPAAVEEVFPVAVVRLGSPEL